MRKVEQQKIQFCPKCNKSQIFIEQKTSKNWEKHTCTGCEYTYTIPEF